MSFGQKINVGDYKVNRDAKKKFIVEMHALLNASECILITQYKGLNVSQLNHLRMQLRISNSGFKVTKNRLTQLALEKTKFSDLAKYFSGPTAIAYSLDPTTIAKVIVDFGKSNKNLILCSGNIGNQFLDKAKIESIASLPPLIELQRKLIGIIQTPMQRLVIISSQPASKIVQVMKARTDKMNQSHNAIM